MDLGGLSGMNMQNVRFLWASDEINAHADEYWTLVMDIARLNNLARIQRCCTIMGRKENEEMSAAQIFYPCMQCADVFFLKVLTCVVDRCSRRMLRLCDLLSDTTAPDMAIAAV
jgi:tyrosyl-tRNA synthetase